MDEEEQELLRRKQTEQKKLAEAKKAEEQLKSALRGAVTPEAYDRLANVQHANAQLYLVAVQNIIGLHRRAQRKLTEEEVVIVLRKIKEASETPTRIRFERK